MSSDEFSIIDQVFATATHSQAGVKLGIGDDAAIVQLQQDQQLVVSVDTMVEGVHFLPDVDAEAIGHKILAVNFSTLR